MDLLYRAFVHQPPLPCPVAAEHADVLANEPQPRPPLPADPLEATWDGLAEAVAGTAWSGRRVIAVTAAERGVGASTIAVGLARALDRRGQWVAVLHGSPLHARYHEDLFEL